LNALVYDLQERRKQRKRERSPTVVVEMVESNKAVYFSRVPIAFGQEELQSFFAVHGRIVEFFFHRERRWGKVTYESTEEQRNCLDQKDYYEKQLHILVEPHRTKRTKRD
jgi:CMP-2-keto-3-deoxyoctulosonic acid synthetase